MPDSKVDQGRRHQLGIQYSVNDFPYYIRTPYTAARETVQKVDNAQRRRQTLNRCPGV
jgi:hypothetical protein